MPRKVYILEKFLLFAFIKTFEIPEIGWNVLWNKYEVQNNPHFIIPEKNSKVFEVFF